MSWRRVLVEPLPEKWCAELKPCRQYPLLRLPATGGVWDE
jgi:hypothetical protein